MAPVDAMITLYDLYSTLDETKPSTSPFVWRTRFALQLKGLPFETRLLGYDEISGKIPRPNIPGLWAYLVTSWHRCPAKNLCIRRIHGIHQGAISIPYHYIICKTQSKMQKQYRGRIPLDPTAKFDEKTVAEMWNETESRLGKLDSAMGDKDTFGQAGEFTFADTALGASLQCVRQALGADSQQWETVKAWHNSRWGRYLDRLEKAA
ncbi:hypothetical protein D9757_007648 [Collybiopsis confluens]|uniref:Glutathione S-transferase UstS-like C-terminal domain-containing protein n=1 Tax=Collybiopsis confluens TaxID=2823264 RepID=A0A8H5H9M5_9AGAR|nr:hypothetical protein D9757_007648 [Collybiopsis confluens]